MSIQEGTLTPERIEIINAHGPYNHSVWSANGISITNEEQLTGRGEALVQLIRSSILKRFSIEEIKKASIVDIGCYDGWILHRLSDLPFDKMVGIEPRLKNIQKGKKIRELLQIPCRVEFQQNDIHNLGDRKYDVVVCVGLLHHLDSISDALRKLRSVCKTLLFVETICLPSKHITPSLKKDIEMKDLIYRYKKPVCGLTCQKYESTIYDGSAIGSTIVSIPSLETLQMYLECNRFDCVEIVVSPDNYRAEVLSKEFQRHATAVCLTAIASEKVDDDKNCETIIQDYESGLMNTVLDRAYVDALYKTVCLNQKPECQTWLSRLTIAYLNAPSTWRPWVAKILKKFTSNKFELEIIRNFIYNPPDKIRLEYAKILFLERRFDDACEVLLAVTQKINADWRSVYRSMFLLSRIYSITGCEDLSHKYRTLCKTSCERYPVDSLNDFSPTVQSE